MKLYKIVIRDKNGKVQQIHEQYAGFVGILDLINEETNKGYSVTITAL